MAHPLPKNMKHLLWIDRTAGVFAGAAMLVLVDWLATLYGMPTDLLLFIGGANGIWALVCAGLAVRRSGIATLFGLAHLVAEALFVGRLAHLEWKWRAHLLATNR